MFPKFRRELVKKTINNGSSAGKDHQLSLNILQLFCNIRTRIVAVSIQYTQNTFSYQQGQNCSQKRNDLLQQKYVSDKIDIDASIGRKIQKNTSKGPTKIASFKSQNCFQKFHNISRPIDEFKPRVVYRLPRRNVGLSLSPYFQIFRPCIYPYTLLEHFYRSYELFRKEKKTSVFLNKDFIINI